MLHKVSAKAIALLKSLIETPSYSGEEEPTANLIEQCLREFDIITHRQNNNIWATNKHFDPLLPSILLNSHHDTVRPNKGYTRAPFLPEVENGKLYGLGSNDAGGCLVSLLAAFVVFHKNNPLKYNLVFAATAEEENGGTKGLGSLLGQLPALDFAIVSEPTQMQMAIAEKGLLVIDAYAQGRAGHAAHKNTDNAIYKAVKDIETLQHCVFPKISDTLGKTTLNVTQINAGTQHNVVPGSCHFVIDVRVNECYQLKEVFALLEAQTQSTLQARSFRNQPSSIPPTHPIVEAGKRLGLESYGSPTLSDQAVLTCPSIKIGPGDSRRSHQADEYIYLSEIEEGITGFIKLLEEII